MAAYPLFFSVIGEQHMTALDFLHSKPLNVKKIMRLCIAACLALFLLFAFLYKQHLVHNALARVKNHAEVVATSLWTYDKRTPTAYLQMATEANRYKAVVIFDETDEAFVRIEGPPPTRVESVFRSVGLIPIHQLEAGIEYDGRPIGKIRADWPSRAVYVYLYILLCLVLLLVATGLFLKLLEAKLHLEYRVRDRTVALENEVKVRLKTEEENQRLQGQLLQAQKMEAIGNLAGGVAHDFNNMLGVILGHTELAMAKLEKSHPLSLNLAEIRRAGERSADITRKLLAFARKQTVAPKVINLNDIVDGMLNMLRRLIGEGVDLIWLPEDNLWPAKVDPSQVDQILVNLCVNSRDALTAGLGKITVETGNTMFDEEYCSTHTGFMPGAYVRITVSDNGCGMDKETLTHIFEPFFTTKGVGEGTGLGMATVYGTVKQNNGFINVYSEPGQGTTVSIYLPRHTEKLEEQAPGDTAEPVSGGSETILLVEDEAAILEMTTIMLHQMGYTVIPARTPAEALRLQEEHGRAIHLVITDMVMPEMNGWDLAQILVDRQPGLKCLFTSGYTGKVIADHGVLDEATHFIQKPFAMNDLAGKIRHAIDQAPR